MRRYMAWSTSKPCKLLASPWRRIRSPPNDTYAALKQTKPEPAWALLFHSTCLPQVSHFIHASNEPATNLSTYLFLSEPMRRICFDTKCLAGHVRQTDRHASAVTAFIKRKRLHVGLCSPKSGGHAGERGASYSAAQGSAARYVTLQPDRHCDTARNSNCARAPR